MYDKKYLSKTLYIIKRQFYPLVRKEDITSHMLTENGDSILIESGENLSTID